MMDMNATLSPGAMMDKLKNAGCAIITGAGICAVITLVPVITFVVYLGVYAYSNPDKSAWYGLESSDK